MLFEINVGNQFGAGRMVRIILTDRAPLCLGTGASLAGHVTNG